MLQILNESLQAIPLSRGISRPTCSCNETSACMSFFSWAVKSIYNSKLKTICPYDDKVLRCSFEHSSLFQSIPFQTSQLILLSKYSSLLVWNSTSSKNDICQSLRDLYHFIIGGIMNFKDILIWNMQHFHCLPYVSMIIIYSWQTFHRRFAWIISLIREDKGNFVF